MRSFCETKADEAGTATERLCETGTYYDRGAARMLERVAQLHFFGRGDKPGSVAKIQSLDFEDNRKDQGSLGGLFVDVALEVDADFFFDDAPVGFFFGVGLLDGFEDDFAGAGDEFLAVVAEESARDDFRLGFHLAGVFVDGNDGDDYAVFGKVFAIADHYIFDFFEGAGIDADAACRDGIAAADTVLREFDALAVFEEENFSGDAA